MDLALQGKAVLVTGGSRGIGRHIALAFAGEGADVAICARNEEKLRQTGNSAPWEDAPGPSRRIFFRKQTADAILVNVVHPSFCKTDRFPARVAARARERGISAAEAKASFASMFPIGRIVEPADIAPLVLFLASPHASAITGQSIAVDGGMSRSVSY